MNTLMKNRLMDTPSMAVQHLVMTDCIQQKIHLLVYFIGSCDLNFSTLDMKTNGHTTNGFSKKLKKPTNVQILSKRFQEQYHIMQIIKVCFRNFHSSFTFYIAGTHLVFRISDLLRLVALQ